MNKSGVTDMEISSCRQALSRSLAACSPEAPSSRVEWHRISDDVKYDMDSLHNTVGRFNQSRGSWNAVVGRQYALTVSHKGMMQLAVRGMNIFVFYA